MRRVILNLAVSLDSFIEGPNGEYDWCFTDQDYGMMEFLAQVDALFLGRRTFDLMRQQEGSFFADKAWYVFSKTLTTTPHPVQLIQDDVAQAVLRIKNEPGKNIWLFGGASLTSSFLNAGLVDELLLAVHPILLGGGKPLFQHLTGRISFDLVKTKTYPNGLVQVHYRKPSID